jgi:hypothetical protein
VTSAASGQPSEPPTPATDVAWRVSTLLTSNGELRERHAFPSLTGDTAEALCEHTALTARLEPDDQSAHLCTLCWLFFGTDLADRLDNGERWGQ